MLNTHNKHPLRSNAERYGNKTQKTDSEDSETTTPSGRKLYYFPFSVLVASPGTSGYTFICYFFGIRNISGTVLSKNE